MIPQCFLGRVCMSVLLAVYFCVKLEPSFNFCYHLENRLSYLKSNDIHCKARRIYTILQHCNAAGNLENGIN